MAKHSRRPPGQEREADVASTPPLPRGLRRGADGRVILDDVEPTSTSDLVEDPNVLDPDADGAPDPVTEAVDAVVGERSSRLRHPARRVMAVARRGRGRDEDHSLEEVGGPIQPTPTIYFGRPPGTENRRAGAAAMVGGVLLLVAAFVPWATREPASLGATTFGWRDASSGYGPGLWMAVLGMIGVGLAVGALSGSTHRGLQVGDVCVGVVAVLIGVVEWIRIRGAADEVADLTDGRASLSPSWGIVLAIAGGIALVVAAVVHRSTLPAWRQG